MGAELNDRGAVSTILFGLLEDSGFDIPSNESMNVIRIDGTLWTTDEPMLWNMARILGATSSRKGAMSTCS